jgi:aminoglycoside phosphotransferase (APT) family kinase protein
MIDKPRDVRKEDELDLSMLSDYLRNNLDELDGDLSIKQFSGGASNLTYLLNFGRLEFILRCPPKGTKSKGAHDMAREYGIMSALKPLYPYVPKMIHFCEDLSVIGREFYLMEKITGIIPRANLPKDLILTKDQVRQLCLNVVDKLIQLHSIPIQGTDLMNFGKGEGYINRQISGWIGRYQKAKTWNVPSCNKVIQWLQDHLPDKERICLIHNDFRFDNVVLAAEEPTKVIGVLDWEMATIGDPLMDLGNSLAYWVQADDDWFMRSIRRQPTHLQGMLTRQEVIEYYCKRMGFESKDFTFYEVYGLFRLIVIIQQIYYRFHHKQTSNPAFKNFWLMVHYLNWRCKRIISKME